MFTLKLYKSYNERLQFVYTICIQELVSGGEIIKVFEYKHYQSALHKLNLLLCTIDPKLFSITKITNEEYTFLPIQENFLEIINSI